MLCMSTSTEKGFMASVKSSGYFAWVAGVLLLTGTVQGGVTTTGEEPWELIKTTAAGRIYHLDFAGSFIPRAMIVTIFDATPESVYAVVSDYDHFAAFIPNVAESRVVAQEGNDQWVYHHLHFPGPIVDRVYVIRSTDNDSQAPQSYYRVQWELDDRLFPDIDLSAGIQPRAFSGYWELKAIGNTNTTEARYAVHSDPGGLIPDWLVTRMTDRYIQQVVEAVRHRLDAGE